LSLILEFYTIVEIVINHQLKPYRNEQFNFHYNSCDRTNGE